PQVSDAVWRSTFHDARAIALDGTLLTLSVPNPLSRDRIVGTYESIVLECLADAAGEPLSLEVRVTGVDADEEHIVDPLTRPAPAEPLDLPEPTAIGGDGLVDPATADPDRYTFSTFVAGPSNRFAHA